MANVRCWLTARVLPRWVVSASTAPDFSGQRGRSVAQTSGTLIRITDASVFGTMILRTLLADSSPQRIQRILLDSAAGDEPSTRELADLAYDDLRAQARRFLLGSAESLGELSEILDERNG